MKTKTKIFLVAVISLPLSLVLFLASLAQTDFVMGHSQGPAWVIFGAMISAMVAAIASVAWFVPLQTAKKQSENNDQADRTGPSNQTVQTDEAESSSSAANSVQSFIVATILAIIILSVGAFLVAIIMESRPRSKRMIAAEAKTMAEQEAVRAMTLLEYRSLIETINDKQSADRLSTLKQLSQFARYRSSIAQEDRQLLRHALSSVMLDQKEEEECRAMATEGLNHMREHASPVTDELIQALQDPYFQVRLNAVYALLTIGGSSDEAAKKVVPHLEALADDQNAKVRSYSGIALRHIERTIRSRRLLEGASKASD